LVAKNFAAIRAAHDYAIEQGWNDWQMQKASAVIPNKIAA